MKAARFIVRGRVQGVFFRASTREQAVSLNITGHARNLLDGSVEVLAYGDAADLDILEAWLHDGPPQATVDELFREEIGAHDAPGDFLVK
ncbi:acylphosphatase [Luteibacter sp. PPL201]|jgi:acylphosphatase|uniref:acylphosphatase n=1 Tax=Luteibacter sahnii TaxID=3021977 RepID=A0ABT6B722_9GAMM|nr:acylphosphatase [Luteibacter sp. PPL193]MDY1548175.1 acylphosphatase [Luteibacter sp. PPL193]